MNFKNFLLEKTLIKDNEEFVKLVQSECKPYLSSVKYDQNILMRAVNISPGILTFSSSVRTDRTPTDTPYAIHKILDRWFLKTFKFKYRSSSLFTGNSKEFIKGYEHNANNIYYIFPKGNFKVCYSKDKDVKDLYVNMISYPMNWMIKLMETKLPEEYLKIFDEHDLNKIKDLNDSKDSKILFRYLLSLISEGSSIEEILETYDNRISKKNLIKFVDTVIFDLLDSLNYIESNKVPHDAINTEIMLNCSEYYALKSNQVKTLKKIFNEV